MTPLSPDRGVLHIRRCGLNQVYRTGDVLLRGELWIYDLCQCRWVVNDQAVHAQRKQDAHG